MADLLFRKAACNVEGNKVSYWHVAGKGNVIPLCESYIATWIGVGTRVHNSSMIMCEVCQELASELIRNNDYRMRSIINKSNEPELIVDGDGQQCSTCYFNRFKRCHRYGPTIRTRKATRLDIMNSQSGYIADRHQGVWPEVPEHGWCGDWKTNE